MRKTPFTVRDLLYLDFDKAASIWSQFEEGLMERVSVTEDSGSDRSAGTKFGIPSVAEANLGVDYQQKRSTLQSRTLHHDVLNRVERGLADAGLITDLSTDVSAGESSAQKIRGVIGKRPYLRAEGASVLEDYRRILAISEKFNDILALVETARQEGVKKSPQYVQLQELVAAASEAAEAIPDRNQKAAQRVKAKEVQRQLDALSKPQLAQKIDEWLVDGMRLWINTFMPSRINFRIYPFNNCPSFQVLCNLQDLHTLFDRGYMTVTPDHVIEVSSRIKEEFHNGKEYYALHGETMRLPEYGDRRPSPDFLRWHNDNVYRR